MSGKWGGTRTYADEVGHVWNYDDAAIRELAKCADEYELSEDGLACAINLAMYPAGGEVSADDIRAWSDEFADEIEFYPDPARNAESVK